MVFNPAVSSRVVVVMGATSGVGLETARRLAQRGDWVVLAGRAEPELQAIAAEIQQQGGRASVVNAEVTQLADMRSVVQHAIDQYGRLDAWVHCAAVTLYGLFEDLTSEDFRQVIETDLMGEVNASMAVLPHFRQQGSGTLVLVGSITGQVPTPYQIAYATAKHAVHGFAQTLQIELKHSNHPANVVQIIPASINTPFFEKARTRLGVAPQPFPPAYPVWMTANAILFALDHPHPEVYVDGASRTFAWLYRLSPTLTRAALGVIGFRAQRTEEYKSLNAPDNLYFHIPGFNRAEGVFQHLTLPFSLYHWLVTHPPLMMVLRFGSLAALAAVIMRRRRKKSWWR